MCAFPQITRGRLPDLGTSAHGLVWWDGHMVTLDSDGGRLLATPVTTHELARGAAPTGAALEVWRAEGECFLKGLSVLDDVAYFGLSPPQRRMVRLRVNTTLVAVDLRSGRELYRRALPTLGLLNLVGHPRYLALPTPPSQIPLDRKRPRLGVGAALPAHQRFIAVGAVDVTALRTAMLSQWDELWSGKHDFQHLFPGLSNANGYSGIFRGVLNAKLVFSATPQAVRKSHTGQAASADALARLPWPKSNRWRVVFPAWRALRGEVLPILDEGTQCHLYLPAAPQRPRRPWRMRGLPGVADPRSRRTPSPTVYTCMATCHTGIPPHVHALPCVHAPHSAHAALRTRPTRILAPQCRTGSFQACPYA